MPNHWYGIDHININTLAPKSETALEVFSKPVAASLASLMRGLKSSITSCAQKELQWQGGTVFQSRYWTLITRNEAEYLRVDAYIRQNPAH